MFCAQKNTCFKFDGGTIGINIFTFFSLFADRLAIGAMSHTELYSSVLWLLLPDRKCIQRKHSFWTLINAQCTQQMEYLHVSLLLLWTMLNACHFTNALRIPFYLSESLFSVLVLIFLYLYLFSQCNNYLATTNNRHVKNKYVLLVTLFVAQM